MSKEKLLKFLEEYSKKSGFSSDRFEKIYTSVNKQIFYDKKSGNCYSTEVDHDGRAVLRQYETNDAAGNEDEEDVARSRREILELCSEDMSWDEFIGVISNNTNKNTTPDYDFNFKKEFAIYKFFTNEKNKSSNRKIKKLEKIIGKTYDSETMRSLRWFRCRITERYESKSIEYLENFYYYLDNKVRTEEASENLSINSVIPFTVTFIASALMLYLSEIGPFPVDNSVHFALQFLIVFILALIVTVLFVFPIFIPVAGLIGTFKKNRLRILLYQDYREVIGNLIDEKNKK